MKFAIVNGQKEEASPKAKGICPHCNSEMIAKCGKIKVWHWAHKGTLSCDPWWESETEWHREWKNQFPNEWQEISHIDTVTGEKHIADVKTPFGLAIEFQHSVLKVEERTARESFYTEMIWVVDGRRNELDANHFHMGLSGPIQKSPLAFQVEWWGKSKLLEYWGDSQVKIYLDFGQDVLWRLILFDAQNKMGAVGPLPKQTFIEDCKKGIGISVSKP